MRNEFPSFVSFAPKDASRSCIFVFDVCYFRFLIYLVLLCFIFVFVFVLIILRGYCPLVFSIILKGVFVSDFVRSLPCLFAKYYSDLFCMGIFTFHLLIK